MRFPETAIESVRLESIHLYENAIPVILHTFGLHKRDLVDENHIKQRLEQINDPIEWEIDARYEERIKGIYSAIIAFISQARFTQETTQSTQLSLLRDANRNLVEAIKDTKHLQKNWLRFMASDNQATINEYKKIACQIGLHIQRIEQFQEAN